MIGPGESNRVSLDGRGGPIASVYLAFPKWVFGGARGTFQAWPYGSSRVYSISLDLVISLLSLVSTGSWILMW